MARGTRQRRVVQAVAPAAPVVTAALAALTDAPPPAAVVLPVAALSHADRNNPDRLSGDELRTYARQFGLSRSECEGMSDARLREQIRYAVYRRYESED